jgi:hypothetical protein
MHEICGAKWKMRNPNTVIVQQSFCPEIKQIIVLAKGSQEVEQI